MNNDIGFSDIVFNTRVELLPLGLFFLNLIIISIMLVRNYKRFGILSLSAYWIIFSFVLCIQVQFFSAFSYINYTASHDIYRYSRFTNITFTICSIGLYSYFVGWLLADKVKFVPIGFNFVQRGTYGFFSSNVLYLMSLGLMGLILVLYIAIGVPFGDSRIFALLNPALRPIINFGTSLFNFLLSIYLISAIITRKKKFYIITLLVVILSLWSGARGSLLNPIVMAVAIISMTNKNKKIFKYVFGAVIIFLILMLMKAIRDGQLLEEGLDFNNMLFETFFGNTFSDLRDFTWIYSWWNGEFLYGKTIFAGVISFVPSFISEYRELWGWGRWSTSLVNLDSSIHGGLRPTVFGEAYFNFGIVGVIALGFFLGLNISRLDKIIYIKRNIDRVTKNELICLIGYSFIYYSIITAFVISSGYFNIYLKVILLLIGSLFVRKISKEIA
ncbi:TPA: oligosaccharide repeat unit polymerase [Klebsiella quasipneumoniae subsp. quasipneumoniae]|nr:oligosaccharide repeat unit polymerase [Klebsiella quasipneumoniae subsp. quasipneumoniae]